MGNKIETPEQAEYVFQIQFTPNQYIDILNYTSYGVIPEPDGCTSCDRYFVRTIIGRIQAHNAEAEGSN